MQRFLLTAGAALALAACQPQASAPTASDSTAHAGMDHSAHAASGQTGGMVYSDVMYLDHMTMHHQMALDMARAVGTRGTSTEVRQMLDGMIRAQSAEIDSMKAWRARWYPDAPATPAPPAEHAAMMGMHMDMGAFENATGADLDRVFLLDMIPHHAGAITMAAEAQKKSERPEIVALSRAIIVEQAREIADMQRLLEATPTP